MIILELALLFLLYILCCNNIIKSHNSYLISPLCVKVLSIEKLNNINVKKIFFINEFEFFLLLAQATSLCFHNLYLKMFIIYYIITSR